MSRLRAPRIGQLWEGPTNALPLAQMTSLRQCVPRRLKRAGATHGGIRGCAAPSVAPRCTGVERALHPSLHPRCTMLFWRCTIVAPSQTDTPCPLPPTMPRPLDMASRLLPIAVRPVDYRPLAEERLHGRSQGPLGAAFHVGMLGEECRGEGLARVGRDMTALCGEGVQQLQEDLFRFHACRTGFIWEVVQIGGKHPLAPAKGNDPPPSRRSWPSCFQGLGHRVASHSHRPL